MNDSIEEIVLSHGLVYMIYGVVLWFVLGRLV